MIFPKFRLYLACALVVANLPAESAEAKAGDTITMKNGDIYIGKVLQNTLEISSPLGSLTIPVQSIKILDLSAGTRQALISSAWEEIINGQLLDKEIRVSRLQDPTLPLLFEDIANIHFERGSGGMDETDFPARLETTWGDRLRVMPRFTMLDIISDGKQNRYPVSRLRHIDANLHGYDDALLVRLTFRQGMPVQGRLQNTDLGLDSPYLPTLTLPPENLSRLTLKHMVSLNSESIFSHRLRNGSGGPQMIRLEGGMFLRGDFQGDGDDDEQPLAEVRLKPFAIGRFEISFEEYAIYCKQQSRCDMPDDQDWGRGNRPVINVSWEEATQYTQWLAAQTGQAYRLPSDAEWEYAHRAGGTSRYPWGDEPGASRANCEGCGSIWDGDKSAPVGRFDPNAFDLYDTAGNVFEWVADCFHDRFSDAPADGSPVEKEGCGKRVIRGGAWSFPPHEIRSANRWRDFPSRRSDDTGFRVALDLE